MRVVAVVCSYWPERLENVLRIIAGLRSCTRPPDRIILWNNHPRAAYESSTFTTVNSGDNFECRAKFVAGLLDPADLYVFCDDDTGVGRTTIEETLKFWQRDLVTGYWGVRLADLGGGKKSFSAGALVGPALVHEPQQVDAFHGRVMLMGYAALVNMLALEERVRLGTRWQQGQGDDIIAGLANPDGAKVLPLRGDAAFVDYGEHGVAMNHAPGYFEMRDEFVNDVLRIRDGEAAA